MALNAPMTAVMRLTPYGKRAVAHSMFAKGCGFVGAALLLRKRGGYEYVVLHLICQGIEILLKALLLAADYDKYQPRLRTLGHKLVRTASEAAAAYGQHPVREKLSRELRSLEILYSSHRLRYSSGYDALVDASTIPSALALRRTLAVLRLAKREKLFE